MIIKKENIHTWVKVLFSDLKNEDIVAVVPKGEHPDNVSTENKLVGQLSKHERCKYVVIQDGINGDYISFNLNENNTLWSVFDFWKKTTKEKTIIELEDGEHVKDLDNKIYRQGAMVHLETSFIVTTEP
jgi:hypothetical protein